MTQSKNTEVIIVGAGPSGLTSAKVLADAGIDTIVLEKSIKPGTKSFISGVVNKESLKNTFSNFEQENSSKLSCPIERSLLEYRAYFLDEASFAFVSLRNKNENSFIVRRDFFNGWLLKEVEKAGASVLCETVVRELIVKDGKVCGVKTDKEELYANVVVVAEGVNSILTKQTGLRKGNLTPNQVFLFIEENIVLPSKTIEERLNLHNNEGVAIKLFTNNLFGLPSISYFYTNKDSISLGTGILLSCSIQKQTNINHYQEELKRHPAIKQLICGGTTNNYTSYILPASVGGCFEIPLPKICSNGCLVIGGAATLVDSFTWDISALGILSGEIAAHSIIRAKDLNDYSENTLSFYEETLNKTTMYNSLQQRPNNLQPQDSNFSTLDSKTLNNLSEFLLQTK